MFKRVFSGLLVLVFALLLVPAAAAQGISIPPAANFFSNGNINILLDSNQMPENCREAPEQLKAEMSIGEQQIPILPTQLKKAPDSFSMKYIFLVDNSAELYKNRRQATGFAESFAENIMAAQSSFSLAVLGEELEWAGRNMDSEGFLKALKELKFSKKNQTCPAEGINALLDAVEAEGIKPNEFVNIFIISTGSLDFMGNDPEMAELILRAEECPYILIHTYGVEAKNDNSAAALSELRKIGRGFHEDSELKGSKAGETQAEYIGNLCLLRYYVLGEIGDPISGSVVFSSEKEGELFRTEFENLPRITEEGISFYEEPAETPQPAAEPSAEPEAPEETEKPESIPPLAGLNIPDTKPGEGALPGIQGEKPSAAPDKLPPAETEEAVPGEAPAKPAPAEAEPGDKTPGEAAPDAETPEDGVPAATPEDGEEPKGEAPEGESPEAQEPAEQPEAEKEKKPGALLYIIGGAGVIALLAVLAAVLLGKKKNKAPAAKAGSPKGGIYMKLEPVCGDYAGRDSEFYLEDEIFIGSDKKCVIRFNDEDVSPIHARIFTDGSMIYIEDLNSLGGTILGGMRLFNRNRLRSGDEISVGSACFRLLF